MPASPSKSLRTYRTKRDFTRTREPAGKVARHTAKSLAFVIQKHDASRLHFDLRLEADGVMKSWAVPKGPSLNPRDKRLAMQVEDHPIEYNKFEGTIPKGEYGGGTVMIWDRGTYEPVDGGGVSAVRTGLRDGKLEFTLHGEKLQGNFALVRMARGEGKEWLLIKQSDEFAGTKAVTSDRDTSVVSKRTMKQIASAGDGSVWHSNAGQNDKGDGKQQAAKKVKPVARRVAETGASAGIMPMLATAATNVPDGEGWAFEPKYDGIRILAFAAGDDVRMLSRNGIDKSGQFPEIAKALSALARKRRTSLVLDGEIVALEGEALGRFQSLQGRVHLRNHGIVEGAHPHGAAVMMLFDILMRGERSLVHEPWTARRKALETAGTNLGNGALRLGEAVVGDSKALLQRAEQERWEGIMAKRTDAPYAAGRRTRDWLKIKLENQQEFVVGGWTEPRNSREHFGALLIGYWQDEKFIYAGHVGGGFSNDLLRDVFRRLRALERKRSPFDVTPATNQPAHWVKPELVVEVKFNEWTRGGVLRQPVFLGVREDKESREVTRDMPEMPDASEGTAIEDDAEIAERPSDVGSALSAIESGSGSGGIPIESSILHVTNLSKVYFRKARKSKGDVLRYYARIAPLLLPHLEGRPLVLKRYPDGIEQPPFFQQKAPDETPKGVRTHTVTAAGKTGEDRLVGGDLMTLLYCAQLGAIDMNPWHSRVDSLADADYSIIDLDPGPRAPFSRVVQMARVVHDVLDAFALHAAVKTSGASGIHIMIPLPEGTSYQSSLLLAQVVASEAAAAAPKQATVVRKVSNRQPGQVYVDYLQNVQGKSVASVFSLRPQPAASVSMPIAWDELTDDLDPRDFTIDVSTADAEARANEFSEVLAHPVDLSVFADATTQQ